jgi:hypothetical protein
MFVTDGPPVGHETLPDFTCSTSKAPPSLDLVLAGGVMAATISEAGTPDRADDYDGIDRGTPRALNVAAGLAFVALSTYSAVTGFQKTSKCRAALKQLRERTPAPRNGASREFPAAIFRNAPFTPVLEAQRFPK